MPDLKYSPPIVNLFNSKKYTCPMQNCNCFMKKLIQKDI